MTIDIASSTNGPALNGPALNSPAPNSHIASGQVLSGHIPSNRTGSPRLRITQRGRSLLMAVIVAPLVVAAAMFALNGGDATASSKGSDVDFQYVTVASGETLWQLAGQLAPTADPREVIDQIVQLNQLDSPDVFAGQELAIPGQFSQK
jgi:LysM domain